MSPPADVGSPALAAPPDEIAQILAPHPLFARFDRASLLAIASQCSFATYPAGATIMREGDPGNFALVTQSTNSVYPLGAAFRSNAAAALPVGVAEVLQATATLRAATTVETDGATFLIVPAELPPRLLVLGAGPDAMPLVEIAGLMNWHVTVFDHRPAYAVAERFPRARRVALNPAGELPRELSTAHYDAAIVMSHHLLSDQAYLAALAEHPAIPYVGLLGPAPRRTRLMQELGEKSRGLNGRLHGPIGLDIGARTPETIALAIVSEIQATLTGRPGGSFSSL